MTAAAIEKSKFPYYCLGQHDDQLRLQESVRNVRQCVMRRKMFEVRRCRTNRCNYFRLIQETVVVPSNLSWAQNWRAVVLNPVRSARMPFCILLPCVENVGKMTLRIVIN